MLSKAISRGAIAGVVILLIVAGLAVSSQGQTSEIKVWQDASHTQPISQGDHISLPYSEPGAEFKSSLHVFVLITNSALDDLNEPVYFFVDEGPGMWELGSNPHEYSGPGLENWFSAPLPPASPTPQSAPVRITYPAHNLTFTFVVEFTGGGVPPPGQNHAPSVSLSFTPAIVTPNDILRIHAAASDPDGDSLTYTWYLNGTEQTSAKTDSVRIDNPPPGTYNIRVVVSDDKGETDEDTVSVTVDGSATPPPPSPGPCAIEYMTLNPLTEIAGPLLTPGKYMVWTSVAGSNRTFTNWVSTGPYDFKAGHEYTIVTGEDTATTGAVDVFKQDNGIAEASAYYVNDDLDHEFAITVCPLSTPPPPPSPGPCAIEYMTLNPLTEIAGPLLTPGRYMVWTSVAGPNRTFSNWLSVGPYEFKAGHEYTIVTGEDTAVTGAVDVFKQDNGMAEASAYYVNDDLNHEFAITVCPLNTPPPPPPNNGPCAIEFMTLNPGTQIAGPLLTPGKYMVWTSVAGSNRTFTNWMSTGPYDLKAGHEYLIIIGQNAALDGTVDVKEGVNGMAEATAQYVNAQSKYEFAITVCPQGPATPPGGGSVAAALDGNDNGVLDDAEIRQAVQYWITGQSVPGTNQTIDDAKIRELVQVWIMGTPLATSAAPTPLSVPVRLSAPGPLTREVAVAGAQGVGLALYDLSGRLIQRYKAPGPQLRFSLRTPDGAPLANGVYLYVVSARQLSGTWRGPVRKLVVLR